MRRFFHSNGKKEVLRTLLAVFAALVIGFVITLFFSKDPIGAYVSFLTGPVTKLNRFGDWIQESITLALLGLAFTLVFKAEIFSLGAEGQMVVGALVSGVVALFVPLPSYFLIPLALIAGSLAGFLLGIIPGYLKAYLKANEIVSSLMLNTIAVKIYEYILTNFLKAPSGGYMASVYFPPEGTLGSFFPNIPFLANIRSVWVDQTTITSLIYVVVIAVIVVAYLMYRTPFGYELRMVGANKKFARYGGTDIKRATMLVTAVSGLFAGLAGTHLSMGVHARLLLNITAGLGFEGVVVALLARNNPLAVPITALAYGYMRAGADIMERSSDISREMVVVIQAIIILLITAERLFPEVRRRVQTHRSKATVKPTPKSRS